MNKTLIYMMIALTFLVFVSCGGMEDATVRSEQRDTSSKVVVVKPAETANLLMDDTKNYTLEEAIKNHFDMNFSFTSVGVSAMYGTSSIGSPMPIPSRAGFIEGSFGWNFFQVEFDGINTRLLSSNVIDVGVLGIGIGIPLFYVTEYNDRPDDYGSMQYHNHEVILSARFNLLGTIMNKLSPLKGSSGYTFDNASIVYSLDYSYKINNFFQLVVSASTDIKKYASLDAGISFFSDSMLYKPVSPEELEQAIRLENLRVIKNELNNNKYVKDNSELLLVAAESGSTEVFRLMVQSEMNPLPYYRDDKPILVTLYQMNDKTYINKLFKYSTGWINNQDDRGYYPIFYAVLYDNLLGLSDLLLTNGATINAKEKTKGMAALHLAIKENRSEVACYLIQKGINVDAKDNENKTPLMYAINTGNIEMVQILIASNADVNVYSKNQQTALMMAIDVNNPDMVKLLIDAKADVNAVDENKQTPLMYAVQADEPKIVKQLIRANADVNAADDNMQTALMYAAQIESTNIVKQLIDAKANVNAADENKQTALIYAITADNLNIVKQLIAANADVNAADEDGVTPIMYSAEAGNADILQTLVDSKADVNAINREGQNVLYYVGDAEFARYLISQGARVKIVDKSGDTPLHWAYKHKKYRALGMMASMQGDLFARDQDNKSVIDYCLKEENVEGLRNVLPYLEKKNMVFTSEKQTALHLAIRYKINDIVSDLISGGADINAKDVDGVSVLQYAFSFNSISLGRYLILNGADVNAKDNEYTSLLHTAGWNAADDWMEMLLNNGADINIRDYYGRTPLMAVVIQGSSLGKDYQAGVRHCIALLYEKGADFSLTSGGGKTALDYAYENDYQMGIQELRKYEDGKNTDTGSSGKSVKEKLKDLKSLLDDGIITQEEFDKKKQELLEEM